MQRIPVYVIIPLLGIVGWCVFGMTGAVVALLFIVLIVIDKRNKPKDSINKVEQMKELKKQLDAGLLSQEKYNEKKQELLSIL